MRFRVFYHPRLATALAAYFDVIRGLALHWLLNMRLECDRRFRERLAYDEVDERAWFFEDASAMSEVERSSRTAALAAVHFTKPTERTDGSFCYICLEPSHLANKCPDRPSLRAAAGLPPLNTFFPEKPRDNQPFLSSRAVFCREFNAGRCTTACMRRLCHVCDKCRKPDHNPINHPASPVTPQNLHSSAPS